MVSVNGAQLVVLIIFAVLGGAGLSAYLFMLGLKAYGYLTMNGGRTCIMCGERTERVIEFSSVAQDNGTIFCGHVCCEDYDKHARLAYLEFRRLAEQEDDPDVLDILETTLLVETRRLQNANASLKVLNKEPTVT